MGPNIGERVASAGEVAAAYAAAVAIVVVPLPSYGFDPTEVAVPWRVLRDAGHDVRFATPDGAPGRADQRMVTGKGLGPLAPVLRADGNARSAHAELLRDDGFSHPISWDAIEVSHLEALLLPGGHDKGVIEYLESTVLQQTVAAAFATGLPVAAICHGVVLAARSHDTHGRSVLHGRRTTALLQSQELAAWWLTRSWLGDYYRTYPETVQHEVTGALAAPSDFVTGPRSLRRDAPGRLGAGFVVRDGNYLSARWPGDAHRFAGELLAMLAN